MPFIHRRMRCRWPPSPSVEDEAVSLSRELHGLFYLEGQSGFEGACARGAIDQLPVLVTLDNASPPPLSQPTESISSDESNGPPTPQPDAMKEPDFRSLGEPFPMAESLMSSEKPHLPSRRSSKKATSRPRRSSSQLSTSRYVDYIPATYDEPEVVKYFSPKLSRSKKIGSASPSRVSSRERSPATTTGSATPSRSGSTRSTRSHTLSSAEKRSPSTSSHRSTRSTSSAVVPTASQSSPRHERRRTQSRLAEIPPPAPEIDDMPESQEKQRGRVHALRREHNVKSSSVPRSSKHITNNAVVSRTSSGSPSRSLVLTRTRTPSNPSDDSDSDASYATAPVSASRPVSVRRVSTEAHSRHASPASRSGSCHSKSRKKRTSPERNAEHEKALVPVSRHSSPSQRNTRSSSPRNVGPRLLPCPRSVPVSGYRDWYTISGLSHLNICPSCRKQMSTSKFKDSLVPALPKSRGQEIRCSFSEPWARLAWLQTIKKGLDDLTLLYQVTQPFPASNPCPGRSVSSQYWYRVVDTNTGMCLPRFSACSTCARNIKTLMPSLRDTFKRSTTKQEQVCDMTTDSPRFIQYIDLLDAAENRAEFSEDDEESANPDISEFLAYARRKQLLRDCRRDRQSLSTWHYMPELPEMTVCEDCYDDVVWPLARANKPIACSFNSSLRLLPGKDRASRCREASCQLYSPRIRAKFRQAVMKNDMAYLEFVALRRFDAEQEYHARREELLEEEKMGYDCDSELTEITEEWRRWE